MSEESRSNHRSEAQPTTLTRLTGLLGSVSPWPAVLGIVAVQANLVEPMTAFAAFAVSLLLCVVTALLAAIALVSTAGQASSLRKPAWTGLIWSGGVLLIGAAAIAPGIGKPPINDITTNTENPPNFKLAWAHPVNHGEDLEYPIAFGPLTRQAYPDLAPVEMKVPAYIAYYRATRAAETLGWIIIGNTPGERVMDAYDESTIFKFVDDVVVRVTTPDGREGESIVDVRSRSRDGRGDLGANANRIRAFVEIL